MWPIFACSMLRRLGPVVLWLLLMGPAAAQIVIVSKPDRSPLEGYAAQELAHFLGAITRQKVQIGTVDVAAEGYVLVGRFDQTPGDLQPQELFLHSMQTDKKPAVLVSGGDPNGVLYAAYALLEHYGYLFEFSGAHVPRRRARLDLSGVNRREKPHIAQRGLRLHLNFPMDQSSYSEAEWRQWLDRVARLKLNFVAFHFYADQPWLAFTYRGVSAMGGDFFNGRHVIGGDYVLPGDLPGRARIENRKRYYPPDLEEIASGSELYAQAQARIRTIIDHAHARGIRCAVSIEPFAPPPVIRAHYAEWVKDFTSPDALLQDVATQRLLALMDAYPQADEYQLISVEGSDDGPRDLNEQDALFAQLRTRYGLPDGLLPDVGTEGDTLSDSGSAGKGAATRRLRFRIVSTLRYVDMARRILETPRIAERLNRDGKMSSIAIYLPHPEALRAALPAIHQMLPPATRLHLLPEYGARGVANQMATWDVLRDGRLQLGVITWLEFDGSMFLPQVSTRALYDAVANARSLPVTTLYANHWRVSGLEADAYVFARAGWRADLSYDYIMDEYLGRLYGIPHIRDARAAYASLEAATLYARSKLPNVGFCWEGYEYSPYPAELLDEGRASFAQAARLFTRLAKGHLDRNARDRARYLANRCTAAVIHLKAIDALSRALAAARVNDNTQARTNARRARRLGYEYLRTYAAFVPDRGDQGVLVNYYYALIWRADHLLHTLKERPAEPVSRRVPDRPSATEAFS
jgi:hypothetical protein